MKKETAKTFRAFLVELAIYAVLVVGYFFLVLHFLGEWLHQLETGHRYTYAGVAILSPSLFKHAPDGAFSLTKLFDRASETERLYGLRLEGVWMHVGTPDAIALAEDAILASAA